MIEVLFGESEAASMKAAKSVVIRRVKEADLIQCFGEEEMALEQLFGTESESGSERFHGGGEARCLERYFEEGSEGVSGWLVEEESGNTSGRFLDKEDIHVSKWSYDEGDGPTSVWAAGKKRPPEKLFAGWIEGSAQEVVCLGFMLDIGDIKEPVDSLYRKKLISSMYGQNQWEQDEDMKKELEKAGDVYAEELQRLYRFLEDEERIRVWYSDAPYSRCGFYHVCRILDKYENEVQAVKMPENIVRGKTITAYSNWGEVAAEEFSSFLPYERKLTKEEIHMYALLRRAG